MPPIRNQSFHGTSTRQHNGGTSCSNGYASFNGASFNSRESYESFNDSARDQLDREEEDAAIDRAVRLYELEAAKSRYLNEEDLRAFATSVFRWFH